MGETSNQSQVPCIVPRHSHCCNGLDYYYYCCGIYSLVLVVVGCWSRAARLPCFSLFTYKYKQCTLYHEKIYYLCIVEQYCFVLY